MTIVIPTKSRRGWTQNEEMTLKDAVDSRGGHHHATTEEFSWGQVAALVPGMSTKQCKDKWVNSLRPGLSFEEWTLQEQWVLIAAHLNLGTEWKKISVQFLPHRAENSIKNHW